jgi:hypothetical protein
MHAAWQVCKANRWATLSLTGDLDARKRQVRRSVLDTASLVWRCLKHPVNRFSLGVGF